MLQQACRPWKYQTVHVNHSHPCFEVAGFCRSNRSVVRKAVTLSFRDIVFEYGGLRMLLDILGSVVALKFQSVSIDGEDGAPVLDNRIRTVCMDNCDFLRRALHLIFGSSCIEGWSLSRFADLHQIAASDSHTSPLPLPRLRELSLDLCGFNWYKPPYQSIMQLPLDVLMLLLERVQSLVAFDAVFSPGVEGYINRIVGQNANTIKSLTLWQDGELLDP